MARMWDLEEEMRRCEDPRQSAKLEDQWHFVIMEISELEVMYGGLTQRPAPTQTDRERDTRRDAA